MKRNHLLNSFLISIIINMVLLLIPTIPSIYKMNLKSKSEEKVNVDFVSLPGKTIPQRRSLSPKTEQFASFSSEQNISVEKYMTTRTYKSILRETLSSSRDPAFLSRISEFGLNNLASVKFDQGQSVTSIASGSASRSKGLGSRQGRSGSGQGNELDGKIRPRESNVSITGYGDKLGGYYNMSLVKYEDSSDNVSINALNQLAEAMNKWTQVTTKVINEPIRLDDLILQQVPLIYITARRPFAFSERERENLRRYFSLGGFMMFSNTSMSQEVANSIGFELWKVLGEPAHDLSEIDKSHPIYSSFFDLKKSSLKGLLGISSNNRIIVIYEDSGYGTAWAEGKDSNKEPYLKLGVNIIAYALTTSPIIISK